MAMTLAACSGGGADNKDDATPGSSSAGLEQAAIARGVIANPKDATLTGLYRLDTDSVCIVPDGRQYRIGAFVDYGQGIQCSGSGSLSRSGPTLHIRLENSQGCRFDAQFQDHRIIFPAELPEGCDSLCSARASFAALKVKQLSNSLSEASALKDARGQSLCPS
ncbi:hypothetical protein [Stakelama sediminis]|nr:hypothetical protein [Stakelama sediminis]